MICWQSTTIDMLSFVETIRTTAVARKLVKMAIVVVGASIQLNCVSRNRKLKSTENGVMIRQIHKIQGHMSSWSGPCDCKRFNLESNSFNAWLATRLLIWCCNSTRESEEGTVVRSTAAYLGPRGHSRAIR